MECALNAKLAYKPVAVCGDPNKRHGIVLAKNELAKDFGVKTAETIWQAKRKCPKLVFVPPRYEEYRKFSAKFREICLSFTDLVEPFGIDECWMDVTGSAKLFGDGPQIADTLRAAIQEKLKITASVGVSFSKAFAKLGSDYKKPNATTVINRENWRKIVCPLPVGRLMFVGGKTSKTLSEMRINTIGELADYNRDFLERRLGKKGGQIHDYANGRDTSPVLPYTQIRQEKSIGNGVTFERDVADFDDLRKRVMQIAETVGLRMRTKRIKATILQVSVKDSQFIALQRQRKLDIPTNLTREIANIAFDIIKENWRQGKPIRTVTITATGLMSADQSVVQLSFLGEDAARRREERLQEVVDKVNTFSTIKYL